MYDIVFKEKSFLSFLIFKSNVEDLVKAIRKTKKFQNIAKTQFKLQPGHIANPNPSFGKMMKPFCIRNSFIFSPSIPADRATDAIYF